MFAGRTSDLIRRSLHITRLGCSIRIQSCAQCPAAVFFSSPHYVKILHYPPVRLPIFTYQHKPKKNQTIEGISSNKQLQSRNSADSQHRKLPSRFPPKRHTIPYHATPCPSPPKAKQSKVQQASATQPPDPTHNSTHHNSPAPPQTSKTTLIALQPLTRPPTRKALQSRIAAFALHAGQRREIGPIRFYGVICLARCSCCCCCCGGGGVFDIV